MARVTLFVGIIVFLCMLGCEPDGSDSAKSLSDDSNVIRCYEPVKIRIVGLTEIILDEYGASRLNVYVDLADSFGSRVKAPGVFRFELYDYVQRTSQHAGKRLFISTDIDLIDPTENNNYWKDHLRAYQFDLPLGFDPRAGQSFLLQVTFNTSTSRRLSSNLQLKN